MYSSVDYGGQVTSLRSKTVETQKTERQEREVSGWCNMYNKYIYISMCSLSFFVKTTSSVLRCFRNYLSITYDYTPCFSGVVPTNKSIEILRLCCSKNKTIFKTPVRGIWPLWHVFLYIFLASSWLFDAKMWFKEADDQTAYIICSYL